MVQLYEANHDNPGIHEASIAPCRDLPEERRLLCQTVQAWDIARGERPLPRPEQIETAPGMSPLIRHTYLIALNRPIEQSRLLRCGPAGLDAMLRQPCSGKTLTEVLPTAIRDQTERSLLAAIQFGKALVDCGDFRDSAGTEVWYRNALMPLAAGDDPCAVTHVLGAVSFRHVI